MLELSSKAFHTLIKTIDTIFGRDYSRYIVLNDGCYLTEIPAANDAEAIAKFEYHQY